MEVLVQVNWKFCALISRVCGLVLCCVVILEERGGVEQRKTTRERKLSAESHRARTGMVRFRSLFECVVLLLWKRKGQKVDIRR